MRVTLVAGQPRQGKTSLALAVARQEAARVLVLDPVGAKVLRDVRGVSSWPELAEWLNSPMASGDHWEIALRSIEPADYAASLKYATHYRFVTLLLDEVLTFTSDREALPWLVRAARTSAHFGGGAGVNLLMTAQRPYDIPPDVRACLTRLFMFATREPADLEYVGKFTLDPELAARVAGLAPHEYLEFPSATGAAQRLESQEVTSEGVLSRSSRRRRIAGVLSDGAQAESDSTPPCRAEVALTRD